MIQPRSPPAFTLQSEYKEMDKTTKSEIWKSTVLCWETALHCMVPFFTVGLCPRWPGDGGWHHMVSLPPFIDSQIFTLVLNSQPTMSRNTAELSFTADQMTFLVREAVHWGQSPRRRRFSYALHVWQKTNWSNTWWPDMKFVKLFTLADFGPKKFTRKCVNRHFRHFTTKVCITQRLFQLFLHRQLVSTQTACVNYKRIG